MPLTFTKALRRGGPAIVRRKVLTPRLSPEVMCVFKIH